MTAPGTPPPKPQPTPAQKCGEATATLVVTHFLTRLEVEAAKAGGSLTIEQIRAAAEWFTTSDLPSFRQTFQRTYDECTQTRDLQKWSGVRKQPFDRILMKKFAHLFPPRSGDDGGQGVLSRRIIPGFNLAVTKMIGPSLYEQCQRKTRAIMDRHPGTGGYLWDDIYADRDARLLANDVLMLVAHYFADFAKRRTWFMDMINGHLGPPSSGTGRDAGEDDFWQLTQHGFSELMRALFADLRHLRQAAPKDLRARYGDQSTQALDTFLAELDRS